MKILHVITTLDVGGAEMHLLAQVTGQCARGHEVHVAYLKGHGTLKADFVRAGATRVEQLGALPLAPFALARAMGRVDLVHTHLLKADMLGALTAFLTFRSRKLVASKHNDEQVLKRPLVSFVHGLLGRVPRRTIVLSDHVGGFIARYGRVSPEKITRIYYGLDPLPFETAARADRALRSALRASFGFRENDVVFTCVARFAPQKAHDILLKALSTARQDPQGDCIRLLLVGDDPFGDGRLRAEALARELQLGPACVFTGVRRDVPALLAASDVFVMCSLWEGLGLVFLEAMATGIPVLATRVSAVPEVVVDTQTGLLVPESDVAALAAGMLTLTADPALRTRLGRAGRERVRAQFGLERMIEETLEVYRGVLGR
ncbi:MAG: glycosyltransferase [Planctomycetes bacterium]|nr:glycosyltransferase [Planctomycetota bacterium]